MPFGTLASRSLLILPSRFPTGLGLKSKLVSGSPSSSHQQHQVPPSSSPPGPGASRQKAMEEGLQHDSVVNLDHVQAVDQKNLHHFVGTLGAKE